MKEFDSITTAKSSRNVSGGLNASIESGCYRKIQSDRSYPEIFVPNSQIASACGITASKIAVGQTIAGVLGTYVGDTNTYSKIKYVEYNYSNSLGWIIWDYVKTGTAKNQYLDGKTHYFSPYLNFTPKIVLIEFRGVHDSCSPTGSHLDQTGIPTNYGEYVLVQFKIGNAHWVNYRYCDVTNSVHTTTDEGFYIFPTWDDTKKRLQIYVSWAREASRGTSANLYVWAAIRHMYFIE